MRWECSECGASVDEEHRPRICRACGTAGVIFVEAVPGIEGDQSCETVFESWLKRGFEREPPSPEKQYLHHHHHHHQI